MRWYIELARRQMRLALCLPTWALLIFVCAQLFLIAAVSLVGLFLADLTSGSDAHLGMIYLLSPVWLHTVPALWLAAILVCEWMWMITGLYRMFGIQPNSIRKRFDPAL